MSNDALAAAAIAEVHTGMIVGLGTGRAATRAIGALAARVAAEGLDLTCVATSRASDELGRRLGLRLVAMDDVAQVDYLFDGADEIDPGLRMIKGRGGAMTREKIVAHAAARRVYLVQEAKRVARLGHGAPLPIEVLRFGLAAVRRSLRALGLDGPVRLAAAAAGGEVLTDAGNPILDVGPFPAGDLAALAAALDALPGVVDHGLFLDEADVVLVEDDRGGVVRLAR